MPSIMICDLKVGQWFEFAIKGGPYQYYVIDKSLYSVFVLSEIKYLAFI
jgi:hypothetical protein